jgi:hypothetical protein
VGRESALNGVIEIACLYLSAKPRRDLNHSSTGRNPEEQPKFFKASALVAVERPPDLGVGSLPGEVRGAVIEDFFESDADWVLTEAVDPDAHSTSDEWKAFISLGSGFAAHNSVYNAREKVGGRFKSTRRKASTTGIAAQSQVCSTTSAHIGRISTSTVMAFTGPVRCHRPSTRPHPLGTLGHQEPMGAWSATAQTPGCVPFGGRARYAERRLVGSAFSRTGPCL